MAKEGNPTIYIKKAFRDFETHDLDDDLCGSILARMEFDDFIAGCKMVEACIVRNVDESFEEAIDWLIEHVRSFEPDVPGRYKVRAGNRYVKLRKRIEPWCIRKARADLEEAESEFKKNNAQGILAALKKLREIRQRRIRFIEGDARMSLWGDCDKLQSKTEEWLKTHKKGIFES